MKRKRLILHIGMHKTGSSSVQRYFSRNRIVLRRMGVCYPRSFGSDGAPQPKHNAIFTTISHEADYGTPHPILGSSTAAIDAICSEIEAAPGDLGVISAEGLSGERPVFAEKMASLAERFDVTVVIFVRRQDHWVESFYKQMVISRDVRETRKFHEFAQAEPTRSHMNYNSIVGWWTSAFGEDRVLVEGFHPTGPRQPLRRLLDKAGLGRTFRWLPFANARENSSPGVEAVEVVRRCNEAGQKVPRDSAHQIEARLGAGEPRYFTESERLGLLKAFEDGNQRLLNRMEPRDHSCLSPNMTKLGQSREQRWADTISAQFWTNSMKLLSLDR